MPSITDDAINQACLITEKHILSMLKKYPVHLVVEALEESIKEKEGDNE